MPRRKGLPPRGRCRPRRPFLGVFKGFLQAGKGNAGFAPSWFRITSYIWHSCRLPLFCGVGTACSTHFGRGIRSEKQIASCSSLLELQDPKVFPSCKHLKRIDRKCVYTQCHICLVLEMVGTKYCIPVPWLSLLGLYPKTVLGRPLVILYNKVSHCPCLAEPWR